MAHEILKNFIKHQKEAGRSFISIDELETMLASEDEVLPIELKKLDLAHQRKNIDDADGGSQHTAVFAGKF